MESCGRGQKKIKRANEINASGSGRAYRDNATETKYDFVSGQYTGYHYYKKTTIIQSYTEGLTAPTSSPAAAGTSVLEIRGG